MTSDPWLKAAEQAERAATRAAEVRRAFRAGTFRRHLADEAAAARKAVEEFEHGDRQDRGTVGADPPSA